jgi:hypothetical protein
MSFYRQFVLVARPSGVQTKRANQLKMNVFANAAPLMLDIKECARYIGHKVAKVVVVDIKRCTFNRILKCLFHLQARFSDFVDNAAFKESNEQLRMTIEVDWRMSF